MQRTAVYTIASKNYLAHVRTLLASVSRYHPQFDRFLILVDEPEECFSLEEEPYEVIRARDLDIPRYEGFSFKYDILELNTAVKPYALQQLFGRGYDQVLYFDPDILLFAPLAPVLEALDGHAVVLTPHMTSPLPEGDDKHPDEHHIMTVGAYNLGFAAFARTGGTERLAQWWCRKCYNGCYREPEAGLFVDQKWADLVPALFDSVCILRHAGCNVAYWNLHERRLDGGTVNGHVPLIFYHFSGLRTDDLDSVSGYQNRVRLADRPDITPLFTDYRQKLMANGYEQCRHWGYAYGCYRNGVVIGHMARRLYPLVEDRFADPFGVGKGTYYRLLQRRGLREKTTDVKALSTGEKAAKMTMVNALLRLTKLLIGVDQFRKLMNYLRRVSVVRNQGFLMR